MGILTIEDLENIQVMGCANSKMASKIIILWWTLSA
jgi:hypothetical protein